MESTKGPMTTHSLLAAVKEQNPELAVLLEPHYTAANHYQDHLRDILLNERRDGGSPRIVVETGVSHGISSDRILSALDEIGIPGHGLLYSVDPAPPDGIFEISHPRWSKCRKLSVEALPYIYENTGPWDVFLHDSDHEIWCQTFEYEVAWHFVRPGGLILSDDATWGMPPHKAWDNFCARHGLTFWKAGACVCARKPMAAPGAPTTRVDSAFIQQVVAEAKALADAAQAAYVPTGLASSTAVPVATGSDWVGTTNSGTPHAVTVGRVSTPRAICLCLPEYPEKIEKAQKHFAERGLTNVEFFWGINAPVAGLATWHPYEVDHPGSGFRMGAKTTGCWLSHYMLWAAMTRMTDDAYLVLEDDAQLDGDFMDKYAQAMRDVPSDYAFLHLGHCCLQGTSTQHVAGAVYEAKNQMCTHAYVVRRNIAPFLLRTLRKCWAPIDIQLVREVFPHVKTYAVVPRIVAQFDTVISP
jgi:GR25 family glycosyltransferase involved in LPS biosynthesis